MGTKPTKGALSRDDLEMMCLQQSVRIAGLEVWQARIVEASKKLYIGARYLPPEEYFHPAENEFLKLIAEANGGE